MPKSRKEAESEVRSWGFNHVFTWTDGPWVPELWMQSRCTDSPHHRNAHYPPHKHSGVTTHLILNGSLTYTYPDEPDAKKESLGVGGRWDVDANTVHEVWVGSEGCTYVIGE
tara:strand:- start:3413 stop:3748 length:336 start_codon:yes stop_codon:yes gene_type:complete